MSSYDYAMEKLEEERREDERAYKEWSECGYICVPVGSNKDKIDRHIARQTGGR